MVKQVELIGTFLRRVGRGITFVQHHAAIGGNCFLLFRTIVQVAHGILPHTLGIFGRYGLVGKYCNKLCVPSSIGKVSAHRTLLGRLRDRLLRTGHRVNSLTTLVNVLHIQNCVLVIIIHKGPGKLFHQRVVADLQIRPLCIKLCQLLFTHNGHMYLALQYRVLGVIAVLIQAGHRVQPVKQRCVLAFPIKASQAHAVQTCAFFQHGFQVNGRAAFYNQCGHVLIAVNLQIGQVVQALCRQACNRRQFSLFNLAALGKRHTGNTAAAGIKIGQVYTSRQADGFLQVRHILQIQVF